MGPISTFLSQTLCQTRCLQRHPDVQVYFILLHSLKRMTGIADAWGLLMLSGLMQPQLGEERWDGGSLVAQVLCWFSLDQKKSVSKTHGVGFPVNENTCYFVYVFSGRGNACSLNGLGAGASS